MAFPTPPNHRGFQSTVRGALQCVSRQVSAARLRGSLQKLDSPIYAERKWAAEPVLSEKDEDKFDDDDEPTCCLQSMFCKIFCSLLLCVLIVGGVMASIYYYVKCEYAIITADYAAITVGHTAVAADYAATTEYCAAIRTDYVWVTFGSVLCLGMVRGQ